ncbi:hypothetical protein BUALT_Bualt02G0064400 [Buddleja alternifolia]|uniref:NB-ARC domain-containing protein n=1 Tax=Buddleja alternifolia TaxID=168488 RepID=A0AAV6Y042_9LAMI|nr:hypothetical protein BUALT_Bualt02G0064400 [Buddleja alternifolia]
MAYYAALVSLVQSLEEINHDHDHDRYRNFLLYNEQITKSLHEKFSLLLASLEDYSSKGDEEADRLERQIRDAACKAQDIIESQISNDIHSGDECHSSSYLQKVNEQVESIVAEVIWIKKSHNCEDLHLQNCSRDIDGSIRAPSDMNIIVGFDEDLAKLKAQLCGESSKLRVIPIVGMGGIGKTTLANTIFHDKLILYHFDIRVWVTVSKDYHIQKILQTILDSLNEVTQEVREMSERELSVYIYQHLKGRRYLVIMDDMWSKQVLNDINRIFPNDHNGSRILLTTRLSDVAVYADSFGSIHQMRFLNEEQRLPLAIVVVAGVLSKINRTRNLVLITKRRSNGKLKSCSIHDLLRDLCTQKVHSENFFQVMDENLYFRAKGTRNIRIEKDREYIRRVCIHPSYFSSIGAKDIGSHVHSILCFSDSYIVCKNLFSSALGFKLLRILDAIQILFTSFPGEIVKLFHLRFFACKIYINRNLSFPPTISQLQNLQTLIVAADMMSPNAGYILLPSEI